MASLAFTGIDNLTVESDGAEVPLMDGSSLEFVRGIEAAGAREQEAPRNYIRILKEVEVRRRDGWARLAPLDGRSVSCTIDFPDPAIGYQEAAITLDGNSARSPVVAARTFATMDDIRQLRERGLAQLEADDVGDLECVVVVDGGRILNRSGLRSATECAELKVLDAVGDMALAPEGYRSGHGLNVELLTTLFADRAAWERTLEG
ncbi:MAG: UDP-3-O-acyl-N-acetylglucosamine deacetylase [Alphaproteobacteria bacterium]|nr:UDP-3-O-acyl-N-acetylglucosamine deacetylase [Alphaproteobacteria bacterium]